MACREARGADDVDVVFEGHLGRLVGCLEHGADVDVEAEVGEGRGDDLEAAVVAVLTHLRHEHPRAAACLLQEGRGPLLQALDHVAVSVLGGVDTGDHPGRRHVAAEDLLHGVAHLADRGAKPHGLDGGFEEVSALFSHLRDILQGLFDSGAVAFALDVLKLCDLLVAHCAGDFQDFPRRLILHAVLVHTDDDVLALVDPGLAARRRLLDAQLRHARLDGLGHAAEGLDLVHDLAGLADDGAREGLDEVGASQGIHHVADLGLFLDDDLRVAGNPGREVRREVGGLVQGVRVQRLGAAQGRRERLEGRADHVVVWVLLREAPAGSLAVGPQDGGAGVLRVELADRLVP